MQNNTIEYDGNVYNTSIRIILDLDESSEVDMVTVQNVNQPEAEVILENVLDQGMRIEAKYDRLERRIVAWKLGLKLAVAAHK